MLDHLLPNEDDDVSILLERIFAKRGIEVLLEDEDREGREDRRRREAHALAATRPGTVEADVVLVAVGVTGNVEGLAGAGVEAGAVQEPREGRRRSTRRTSKTSGPSATASPALARAGWRWAATATPTSPTSPTTRRSTASSGSVGVSRPRRSTTSTSPAAPTRTRRSPAWA